MGRWQLPHKGHFQLIRKAFDVADDVIVVVGSALRARDPANPFTWQERIAMLQAGFRSELSTKQAEHVRFVPVRDYANDQRWCQAVRAGVQSIVGNAAGNRTVVVGHEKDSTSYYLNLFHPWGLHKVEEKFYDLDATPLRNVFFGAQDVSSALSVLAPMVPAGVLSYLQAWAELPVRQHVSDEKLALEDYRKKWQFAVALTGDAVVSVNTPEGRKVLLVRRKGPIGRGLWAIPGGFMEAMELLLTTALRELKEETGLEIWRQQVSELLKGVFISETPNRSLRGRIVTHAHHFDLGNHKNPPEVAASDDAEDVSWVKVSDLPYMLEQLFEDHGLILEHFFGTFDDAVAHRFSTEGA
jgi:bifunctional NMN adenylyltransferase/nudix hydrolase